MLIETLHTYINNYRTVQFVYTLKYIVPVIGVQELKPVGMDQSKDAAGLDVNLAKNRFTNILPYDRTRIKLMAGDDAEEGRDYINGNWMPVR